MRLLFARMAVIAPKSIDGFIAYQNFMLGTLAFWFQDFGIYDRIHNF